MRRVVLLCAVVLGSLMALAADSFDEGLLEASWFGTGEMQFKKTEDIDYLWVKPGFSVKDHAIKIEPWEDFKFIHKAKRDTKDASKAGELTDTMPSRLRGSLSQALEGVAKVSKEDGDLLLVGRFVDVNAGSKAAKWLVGFGAGSATATWDLKIVNKETGELLVAIHHRAVSGTSMSEIQDKIDKWLEKFAVALRADLAQYKTGKPVKK